MLWADRLAAGVLAPLAMWVLASGLDDLFLDLCSLYYRLVDGCRRRREPCASLINDRQECLSSQKKIALLIPAWREEAIIEQMLDHNIAAIQYADYEIFIGVYPNDLRTLSRVAACEQKYRRVHRVVCPHDGPTSKADCLNWVYQGILLYEEKNGCRFDVLLHHDAEDLIHPKSLVTINRYCERYDMVQVPVLPLPTPWWDFTHGVYCDEFAQSHCKHLPVRQRLGGFLPSCGVGTAYRRRALDRLAWNNGDLPFRPESLTEDYRMGLELHRLGCSQILLDPFAGDQVPAATREYFPRRFRSSVRQKARWTVGIALQSWEQIGWDAGPGQLYWLWRDRKGLVGNLLTLLANILFLYGLAGWIWSDLARVPWGLARLAGSIPLLPWILALNTALIIVRQTSRACCAARVYGWRHAWLSPIRSIWGNFVNFCATVRGLALFAGARVRREAPRWLKTDHCYPSRQMLRDHKRRLGELLTEMQLLPAARVEEWLRSLAPGERLGEQLVRVGALSETEVYRALSVQQNIPFEPLAPEGLEEDAVHRLPPTVASGLGVIPVRITHERYLWVAGPELPSDALAETITQVTSLTPCFQLMTPSNYRELAKYLEGIEKLRN